MIDKIGLFPTCNKLVPKTYKQYKLKCFSLLFDEYVPLFLGWKLMLFALVECRYIKKDTRRQEKWNGSRGAPSRKEHKTRCRKRAHFACEKTHSRRHNGGNVLMKSQMNLKNQKHAREVFSVRTLVLYVDVAIKSYAISP